VPAPEGADAERRDGHAAPQELVGDPDLTPGGLFDGKRHDGIFDFWRDPVLQDGLASRNFLQGEFATFDGVDGPTSTASKCQGVAAGAPQKREIVHEEVYQSRY